jgi:hypothetical protein
MSLSTLLMAAIAFQGTTPAKTLEAEFAPEAAYKGRVTGSFIRQRSPEILLGLAKQVREGKASLLQLEHLAGPQTARALVSPAVAAKLDPKRLFRSPSLPSAGKAKPKLNPTIAAVLNAAMASIPEYSPSTLTFPGIYDGSKSDQVLYLTSTTDGPISASLDPEPNYQITELVSYDGVLVAQNGGILLPRPATRKTSAPWTIQALAGQRVAVKIRFEPKFDLFKNPAGKKMTNLRLEGRSSNLKLLSAKPWKLTVPVRGQFNGVSFGPIVFPRNAEIQFVKPEAYVPSKAYPMDAKAVVINSKEAIQGTFHPVDLPEGIAMKPLPFTVKKGETKEISLGLTVTPPNSGGTVWNMPHEVPRSIRVRADIAGKSYFLDFYALFFEGFHHWQSLGNDVGSCSGVGVQLYIGSSGNFHMSFFGYNNDLLFWRGVLAQGYFDGKEELYLGGTVDANDSFIINYGMHRQKFEDNFTSIIHKKLGLKISVWLP